MAALESPISPAQSGRKPVVTPQGMALTCARFTQEITANKSGTAVIGYLPANALPVMLFVRSEAIGATFKVDLGLEDADSPGGIDTDGAAGGKWLSASTAGSSAAAYTQVVPAGFGTIKPSTEKRAILLNVTTAGATGGTYGIDLYYASV